jgi:hypothetical protein
VDEATGKIVAIATQSTAAISADYGLPALSVATALSPSALAIISANSKPASAR